MAWKTEMTIMLRVLIDDLGEDDFCDDRLHHLLVVAGSYVEQDLELTTDYTINIVTPDFDPDPTTSTPRDDDFVNLTVLKAACLIDKGSLRAAAAINGLEARCGPAQLKVLRRMDGFATLIEHGYCKAYEEAMLQYRFGNANIIRGIMSPFINEDFVPHLSTDPRYKN